MKIMGRLLPAFGLTALGLLLGGPAAAASTGIDEAGAVQRADFVKRDIFRRHGVHAPLGDGELFERRDARRFDPLAQTRILNERLDLPKIPAQ